MSKPFNTVTVALWQIESNWEFVIAPDRSICSSGPGAGREDVGFTGLVLGKPQQLRDLARL
jgi:hypothetical protein